MHPRWATGLAAGTALVASGLCARAARRAGNGRARVAWTSQAIACLLWILAPLAWLLAPVGPGGGWRPSVEAGRLGLLAFVAAGLWLTSRASDWRARLRLVLDGT